MIKRTILFVLMTAVGMVSMLTFSIYAWAFPTTLFPTSLWQDPFTGGQITVTSVIGKDNTSWNYVVNNLSYNPLGEGLEYFQLPPLPLGITVNSMRAPSPDWIMFPSPPTWETTPGPPTAGILQGSQGVFSLQTSHSVGVQSATGLAGAPPVAPFTGSLIVPDPVDPVVATLTSVSGTVTFNPYIPPVGNVGPFPAEAGELLLVGDIIATGSDGAATIVFNDGEALELGPDSTVGLGAEVLGKPLHTYFMTLVGKLWHFIGGPVPGEFEIETLNGVIGIRGTEIEGSDDATSTTVHVISGLVEVADLTSGFLQTITDVPEETTFTLTTPVPEPATMLLLGSGLIGLWGLRRKFRK